MSEHFPWWGVALGILVSLCLAYPMLRGITTAFGPRPKKIEGLPKEPTGFFHKAQERILIFDNIMSDDFGNSEIIPWSIPDMVNRGVRVAIITGPDVLVMSHAVLRAIKDNPAVEFYLIPNRQRIWFQEWDTKGRLKYFRHRRFITKDGHAIVIDAPTPFFVPWFLAERHPPTFTIYGFDTFFGEYYEAVFAETQQKAIRVDTRNLVTFVKTHGQWAMWGDGGPTAATPTQIAELAERLGEVLEPEEQLALPGLAAIL